MPGFIIHMSMGDPNILDPNNPKYTPSYKKAYAIGLVLPDIAKEGLIKTKEDFDRFFSGCDEKDIITYEVYLEFCKNNHFNPNPNNPDVQDTRDPNLTKFIATPYVNMDSPLWQGVFCHLCGDKICYYKDYCFDEATAMKNYAAEVGQLSHWDPQIWQNSKTGQIWYDDYNVLNSSIENKFHVLDNLRSILSPELLQELLISFGVKFSADREKPTYMNLGNFYKSITFLRKNLKTINTDSIIRILRLLESKDNSLEHIYTD